MDLPSEKGPGSQDDGPTGKPPSIGSHYTSNPTTGQFEAHDGTLHRQKPCLLLEDRSHCPPIQATVALGPGRPDGRPLGPIQHPELNACAVGGPSHHPTQSIHLTNHRALGDSTDRRVARHLANGFEILSQQQRASTQAGGGHGGFAARVAPADHDHIKLLHEGKVCAAQWLRADFAQRPDPCDFPARNHCMLPIDPHPELQGPADELVLGQLGAVRVVYRHIQQMCAGLVFRIEATDESKTAVGLEQYRDAVQRVMPRVKHVPRHITPSRHKTCRTPR
jgi:hypothetical protein